MNHTVFDLIHTLKKQLLTITETDHTAELEAWWLLEEITHQNKAMLIAQQKIDLSDKQEQQLTQWLDERIQQKKPLQYILGSVPFCNVTILVEPPMLIPRPETEQLVTWLIEQFKESTQQHFDILDLCTGSGCIGIALAAAFPQAHIIGIDINPDAIKLAEKNKALNKLSNISFMQSDLYEKLDPNKKFDLIVSNPPYLSEASYVKVSQEIRHWEDRKALVGDKNGMYFYEKIIQQAPSFLKNQTHENDKYFPRLVFEIGIDQKDLKEVFLKNNFTHIHTYTDLQGKKRWVSAHI